MDFDETRLYYSYQDLQAENDDEGDGNEDAHDDNDDDDDANVDLQAVRRHFREFLRNYRLGSHRYLYREKLLRMHRRLAQSAEPNPVAESGAGTVGSSESASAAAIGSSGGKNANVAKLEVDLAHVGEYHASLLGHVLHRPALVLPCLEQAATDALQTLLYRDGEAPRHDPEPPPGGATAGPTHPPGGATANSSSAADALAMVVGLNIQILLTGNLQPTALRSIKSEHMNRLLRCPGIVISCSPVRNRAVQMTVRCFRCLDTRVVAGSSEGGPFSSVALPSACQGPDPQPCGRYPYGVVPDESRFVDQQTLKLQEAPEKVPTGEMPRSVMLSVERSLVDAASPGTRVHVLCIPTLLASSSPAGAGASARNNRNEAKAVYLRVVGMVRDNATAHGEAVTFTPAEEEAFQTLARHPQVYDILSRSIAPNIYGSYTVDIKRSLACQLFGGSRKKLPDGVRLRGDINVLLLGDPSMAKSQFLKFISKVAPVGIYTSGKGSSAAGLTASVVKDAKGEFYLEGGAMVLADGGVVCIDEFDKMRPNDRVAIHEAMEQQTISIAKAGITTVLNSRSSVLAAANPVFGRYDDYKSASENIDLMTTILSRFDLIFLVRDVREEERDRLICQHVMGVHIQSSRSADGGLGHQTSAGGGGASAMSYRMAPTGPGDGQDAASDGSASMTPEAIAESVLRVAASGRGELEVQAMRKFVQYAKAKCSPRLGDEAGQVLASSYVKIRDQVRRSAIDSAGGSEAADGAPAAIPITVRQLEALVRLSESLAKMRLDPEVRAEDVTEALRLFQVSTMAANAADQVNEKALSSTGGGSSSSSGHQHHREEMDRTEAFLRSRLQLGSLVNKLKIIEEAAGQGYNAVLVARALAIMASRGEVLERNQGRLLKRLK